MEAIFRVRNCRFRGLLIESIEDLKGGVYLLKYQDQPMDKHCIQMQNILRAANVKTTKKVTVDITAFFNDYQSPIDKSVWFKGIKLESVDQQIAKTLTKRLNIDLGVVKRKHTIQDRNVAKAAEKKKILEDKQALLEEQFLGQRAKRLAELSKEWKQQRGNME